MVRIFLFLLFLSSFLLTVSLFSAGTWDPLSLANAWAGCPPFFSCARCALLPLTNARRFAFVLLILFLFADRPALLSAPSLRATRRPSPYDAPRHASRVLLVVPPSRHASPLRHASRRASVTRPPCRVAPPSCAPLVASRLRHVPSLSRRVAPSSRVPLVALRRAFVTRRALPRVGFRHASRLVASTLVASPCHVATLGLDLRWRWCGWAGGG